MDVTVKFGYSRSNGSRGIWGADFLSNEHDRSLSHKAETLNESCGFLPPRRFPMGTDPRVPWALGTARSVDSFTLTQPEDDSPPCSFTHHSSNRCRCQHRPALRSLAVDTSWFVDWSRNVYQIDETVQKWMLKQEVHQLTGPGKTLHNSDWSEWLVV